MKTLIERPTNIPNLTPLNWEEHGIARGKYGTIKIHDEHKRKVITLPKTQLLEGVYLYFDQVSSRRLKEKNCEDEPEKSMSEMTEKELKAHKSQQRIDALVAEFDRLAMSEDIPEERALVRLLKKYKRDLPILDGYFHKAFRQVDVTDSGCVDMVFWELLQGNNNFWKLFEKHKEPETELSETAN